MISLDQLKATAKRSGLTVYQQEKDYFLKTFLYFYYRRYSDAVFKGGTCMRYLFGLDRFSEDLDFNLTVPPVRFRAQVKRTVRELESIGIEAYFIKEEQFEHAYACEIGFNGPLYRETAQTRNKIRIDAGKRTEILRDPEWRMISSEYPETRERFLVLAMNEEEMLVEKIIAMIERKKGMDLYDVWFMLNRDVKVDEELFIKKSPSKLRFDLLVSEKDYERDVKRLMRRVVPYSHIMRDLKNSLSALE